MSESHSNDKLGPLPEPYMRSPVRTIPPRPAMPLYTEENMRAYAAQAVAAERELYGQVCEQYDAAVQEIERLRGIVPEVLEDLNENLCLENYELRQKLAETQRDFQQAVAAERERCAKPLEDDAARLLAPKRTNDVDRHVADVLQRHADRIRGPNPTISGA